MAAEKDGGGPSDTVHDAGREPSLDELLRSLNLRGEDIEGLFVAKSEVEIKIKLTRVFDCCSWLLGFQNRGICGKLVYLVDSEKENTW
jgi:hypothetical protein